MVKGIGPIYAGKLVKAFGATVFDVIEQSPQRLREIPGIGEVRARKITSGWADQKVIRSIMVFLHAHGVSTSRAVRIFKTYGQSATISFQKTLTDWPRTFAASGSCPPIPLPRKSGSRSIPHCVPRRVSPMP